MSQPTLVSDKIVSVQVKDNTNNSDLEENVNADPNVSFISWISCADQLENLINEFNLCGVILTKLKTETSPNLLIFFFWKVFKS